MASNRSSTSQHSTTTAAASSNNNSNNSDSTSSLWSIAVKSVGSGGEEASTMRDFRVAVHPDDGIAVLYDRIREETGLAAHRQRLIYRGRLIGGSGGGITGTTTASSSSSSDSSQQQKEPHHRLRIRDITGLADGHTIHLVKRQQETEETGTAITTNNETNNNNNRDEGEESENTISTTTSLLAALLGMSSSSSSSGSGGGGVTRSRRQPYRLTAEDLVRPDPGTLEPVRQGLLTMHTLLQNTTSSSRTFYRGQWIDCRDTVNQWLEATVMEIVTPEEILGVPVLPSPSTTSSSSLQQPTTDPAVSVGDLDGRRRLLLEPCDDDPESADEQIDGVYYRYRSNNRNVQLLHVHYNGWPAVRWDEWIRSDSERIRAFRTRTRHHPTSSTTMASSPTIQSARPDAPSTRILSSSSSSITANYSEEQDRLALLPELQRVLSSVQVRLENVSPTTTSSSTISSNQQAAAASTTTTTTGTHLPWNASAAAAAAAAVTEHHDHHSSREHRRQELAALAPLLDRLGRTLTDAAPHVAALAASMMTENEREEDGVNNDETESSTEEHPSTLGGLLSLLSRDRRRRNGQSVSSSAAVPSDGVSFSQASSTNEQTTVAEGEDEGEEEEEEEAPNPDYSDFATGFVNTTRGEVRSGPRSSRSSSSSDDFASLLGAYLAAATLASADDNEGTETTGLGRLFQNRGAGGGGGGGGGGIDIHIHAVVTAPGTTATTAATTLPTATPVNTTTTNNNNGTALGNLFASSTPREPARRSRSLRARSSTTANNSSAQAANDEDLGIFSELYSENPEGVNPNSPTQQRDAETEQNRPSTGTSNHGTRNNSTGRERRGGGGGGVLGRFFRRQSDSSNHG